MACRYTYKGKTYEAHEFDDVLRSMSPAEIAKYIPGITAVPSAPFITDTKAWTALALKRMIAYSVENGFDRIAWTTGEQQAERYDLSKQIKSLEYIKRGDSYELGMELQNGDGYNPGTFPASQLPDVVGKEVAQKILDGEGKSYRGHEGKTLEGLDLKVGGEGMKGYYDNIIHQVANDVLKKLGGGKVESILFGHNIGSRYAKSNSVIIEGTTVVDLVTGNNLYTGEDFNEAVQWARDEGYAIDHLPLLQPGFDITPELRVKVEQGLPLFSRADVVDRQFTPKQLKALGTYAGGLTRLQLVELYKNELPQLLDYSRWVDAQDTVRVKLMDAADEVLKQWRDLSMKESDRVADLMLAATTGKVFPDKPFDEQPRVSALLLLRGRIMKSARKDGASEQEMAERIAPVADEIARLKAKYQEVKDMWDSLSPDAKAVYKSVEAAHTKARNQMFVELKARITRMGVTQKTKDAMLEDLTRADTKSRLSGPYFPLSRFGDFILIATKGDELIRSHFESDKERKRAAKELEAQGYEIKLTDTSNALRYSAGDVEYRALTEMAKKITEASKDPKAAQDLVDDINQVMLRLAPAASFRRHFIHRKGTPGYSRDAMRGFADSMAASSNNIANIAYGDRITAVIDEMNKSIEAMSGDVDALQNVLDEIRKREELLRKTSVHPVAAAIGQVGFLMSLGITPAAGIVNILQTPFFTFPWLAARYGTAKATAALAKASADVTRSVSVKDGMQKVFDVTRLDLTENEIRAIQDLIDSGDIDVTQTMDLIDASKTQLRGRSKGEDTMLAAMKMAGLPFHVAEVINRQVTALATYRLALERMGDHDSAVDVARKAINDTHFNYKRSNRARFMQGNFMRVITMFKQYAQNTTFLLGNTFKQMFDGATPEVRTIARKQFALMMAMGFMGSGILGLPLGIEGAVVAGGMAGFKVAGRKGMLAGALLPLILMALVKGLGDDDGEDVDTEIKNFLADHLGQTWGEVVASGPARLLGIDISQRVNLDKLWIRKPDASLEGKDAYYAWLQALMGPVSGYGLSWFVTAPQFFREGNYWRAIEVSMPKFIKDTMRAIRYYNEGIRSSTGNKLVERDLTPYELAMRGIGFGSAVEARAQERNAAIRAKDKTLSSRRSTLVEKYLNASSDDRAAIREKISDFSEKYPAYRITSRDLLNSTKARRRAQRETIGGVRVSRKHAQTRDVGRFVGQE